MYVLPENTRPHCNYKIIGGGGGRGDGVTLMKSLLIFQFNYNPVIWIYHSH